jgi:hypothetical protein
VKHQLTKENVQPTVNKFNSPLLQGEIQHISKNESVVNTIKKISTKQQDTKT